MFNMEEAKTMKTPMSSSIKIDKDKKGKSIDSTMYRGMIDVDFFGCRVERKNTSSTCHFIGHSFVSWHSKKQNLIALSTEEAKYIAPLLPYFFFHMAPRQEYATSKAQSKRPVEASQLEARQKARRIHLGYLMMMYMISCCESMTRVLPYGRFLTRVLKDIGVDLSKETNFEASNTYDTYDDQSMAMMKFEKALCGSWLRRAKRTPA
ncbi:hypothetical protein CK203_057447 [Vitis vinifera]|uniref:Uncharacterized protein n=1 Tax=Vitis vinifera TaxID=29760 RepID=A0A438GLC1_VITVI|nr:hypothetical protein CK203_057447 [Vitis vinifera]